MKIQSLGLRVVAFAAGVVMLGFSCLASADPPSRVIRLGYTSGPVSFSPAGEDDWVQAAINRPLTVGDRLWVDSGARAELQIGGAVLGLNAGTSITVLNLTDEIAQLQLSQGTVNVRARRVDANQTLEIDTPNLALTVRQPGQFRIAVDSEGNSTDVVVRRGRGEVYGEDASYVLDAQHPYRFYGTGLREYEALAAPRVDDFERWCAERDRLFEKSVSARYVSSDVIGYQDLDANGSWSNQPTYGNVWFPNRVDASWAPYRDGHWAWVDPWGWTWVDDAPWGFAVSHYGRWSNFGGRWGWVPGPARTRAYYAPALVAFVGGNNFQLSISSGNVGAVGWFPLGPREVYRPWYSTSRRYFENVNVSNTVVNTTVVNNYYNNNNVTNVNYVNRQVPGAVVAVPTTAFVQSQPVGRSAVRVTPQMVASAPVAVLPGIAPTERSVRGAAAQGGRPSARVVERSVVARTAPAPTPPSFAAQQSQLQARQGKPLEDTERRQLRSAQAAPATPAPAVNVVAQPKAAAPAATMPPSSQLPAGMMGRDDRRGRTAEQKGDSPQAQRTAPGQPPQPGTAPQAQQTAPGQVVPPQVAQPGAAPQTERNAAERGKGQQRGRQPEAPPANNQAVTPAPQPQAATPPAPAAQAPVARPPTAPAEQPGVAQQRGRGERGQGAERGRQPESTPGTPPQAASPELQPRASSPSQTRQQQQRAEQQKSQVPPQAVAPAPQAVAPAPQPVQPPPQRSAQPRPAPPPQAAPPAVAQQPAPRPESTRQAERRAPEAVPPAARPAPVAAAAPPQQPAPPEQRQAGRGNNKKDKDKDDEDKKQKGG